MVPLGGETLNSPALSALHASMNPNADGKTGHGFKRSGS